MTGTVDISPIFTAINQGAVTLVSGAIATLVGWVGYEVKKFFGAKAESKASDDLNTALQNGVQIAMVKLQAWETAHKDVEVQGAIQRMAVQYAIDRAPDAIDRFGLSPEVLAEKALAYLPPPPPTPLIQGEALAALQPAVVESKDLPAPK